MFFFSTMVKSVNDNIRAGEFLSAFTLFCSWALIPILVVGCGSGFVWVLYSMLSHAFSYGVLAGAGGSVLLVVFLGAAAAVGRAMGEGLGDWLGGKFLEDDSKKSR